MTQLTLTQTIREIENFIETGNGDAGRLYHILECLENNRPLYRSDQLYLENKLDASFLTYDEEPVSENNLVPQIQQLIDNGDGDIGRLLHIRNMLLKNKNSLFF